MAEPIPACRQAWLRPSLDARGYRGDLGIRVGPSIFGIRDQPIDRPALDLVGRPRPLISDSLSRAGARAPREGYSANGTPVDYRVRLTSTPCHYGGRRWWWICPMSGRRVAKLHLPPGGTVFGARLEYRLAYRSQRITALDRSHERQRRIYRRLGADYKDFEQPPPLRPKGMHRRTYERLTAELHDATDQHDLLFMIAAAPLMARLMKADARRRCNR